MDLTQIFEVVKNAVVAFIESGAIEKIFAAAEKALPYVEKLLGTVAGLING